MRGAALMLAIGVCLGAASVDAASPARACIRESCRPAGAACANAFRQTKGPSLAACGPTRRRQDPCRKAIRRTVRDGIHACQAAARACRECCRTSGDACPVGVCGNRLVEADEACDGGTRGSCSGTCRDDCTCVPTLLVPMCGNGDLESGEQCDGDADAACPGRCDDACVCTPAPSSCGNAFLDTGEECDAVADAACPGRCNADCTCGPPPVCGNGMLEASEDCEPDGENYDCPGRCLPDCRCPECGDDVLDPPLEECEPGLAGACSEVCSEISCECVSSTTDDCEAPRVLAGLPALDRQMTFGATTVPDDPVIACTLPPATAHDHTVWYAVTAPGVGRLRVDSAGSSYDTLLVAYTGTCGQLTPVACNDDGASRTAALDFPVTAGTDYLVEAVAYRGLGGGELRLDASFRPCGNGIHDAGEACEPGVGGCEGGLCSEECFCLAAPADECVQAAPGAPPIDVWLAAYTATGTTADPKISCGGLPPAPSVWFKFVAPTNGEVQVGTSGSDYDTVVAVYTGTCDALTEVACSDDYDDLTSRAFVEVSAGVEYTVLVIPYLSLPPNRLHLSMSYVDQP